jgi:hypothetical protein
MELVLGIPSYGYYVLLYSSLPIASAPNRGPMGGSP